MILDKIVSHKKKEVEDLKSDISYKDMEKKALSVQKKFSFYNAIKKDGISLIAEIKKASPSKGIIRQDFDPLKIATEFKNNNARAISVLTDKKFFMGDNSYLTTVAENIDLPVLRKDFIIDEIQVLEAKAIGASAILLIASILNNKQFEKLYSLARDLEMDVLAEIHNTEEYEILNNTCRIVGINNRNLQTFEVDLYTTKKVMKQVPSNKLIVCESGILNANDLNTVNTFGVDAVLIGEGLAKDHNLIKCFKA